MPESAPSVFFPRKGSNGLPSFNTTFEKTTKKWKTKKTLKESTQSAFTYLS